MADLEERASSEHRIELVVAPADIDELGHVSNLVYLRWVQDVAKAHSESVGWSTTRYFEFGAVFVVRRHDIEYLLPAVDGDVLEVATWVSAWRGASSERRTRITRKRDGKELCRATTQWVLIATEGGRPRRIPAEMHADFGSPEKAATRLA